MLNQELLKIDLSAAAAGSAGTAVDGASVDMSGYEGAMFHCTIATANAGNFIKVQGSDNNSDWDDLADTAVIAATNADIVLIEVLKPKHRYLRPVVIRAGANTATGDLYAIRYGARKEPVQNAEAGVLVEAAVVTPEEGTA
jgi:hypothetical protein